MSIRKDLAPPPDKPYPSSLPGKPQSRSITHWAESPPFKPPLPIENARITRRNANAHAYRQTGNPLTWYQYISFGFYSYDDCHDFEKVWNATENDILARNKIVWTEYSYLRMNSIDLNDSIDTWITTVARPYLETHDPDYVLATELAYEDRMEEDNNCRIATNTGAGTELPWTTVVSNQRNTKLGQSKASHFNLPPEKNQNPDSAINHIETPPRMERHINNKLLNAQYYSPLLSSEPTTILNDTDEDTMMPDQAAANPNITINPHPTMTTTEFPNQETHYPDTSTDPTIAQAKNTPLPNTTPNRNRPTSTHHKHQNNLSIHQEQNQKLNATTPVQTNTQHTNSSSTATDANINNSDTTRPNPYKRPTASIQSRTSKYQPSLTDDQLARVHINDGTQRLTLRWQAHHFDELEEENADPHE